MINFCQLSDTDIQEVTEIHKVCLQEHWSSEVFQDTFNDPVCHSFCLKEERIIGFLIYRTILDNLVEILTFVVRPDYQGKGYGRLILFHFMTEHLKNSVQKVILEVRESNKNAIHLYHEFGFKTVGKRKNYYLGDVGKKEDALLLQLDLKKEKIILA